MIRKLSLAVLAVTAVASFALKAGSINTSFQAKVNVPTNCSFTTSNAPVLDFVSYDPFGAQFAGTADVPATTTVSIICTKGTQPTIALDGGTNGSGSTRLMKHASLADTLTYTVNKPDSSNNDSLTVWAPNTSITLAASTGRATPIDVNLFGHLAGGQDVSTGNYSDTLKATVNY